MVYIKRTIYEDALISKEEIEELKKNYPPIAWKCEFECLFIQDALSVFQDYDKCFDIEKYKEGGKCWCGIDPSSVGSDNTIVTLVNTHNEIKQYKIDGSLTANMHRLHQSSIDTAQSQHIVRATASVKLWRMKFPNS